MYQVESSRVLVNAPPLRRRRSLRVPRTVVLLGFTSLLTDISAEMVTTVLPLYVFLALGASPLQVSIIDGLGHWRLHVLDLRSLRDRPLAERRSIEDQAEWLDDAHVPYGDGNDVWVARADGGGRPRRLLRRADSATVSH
jgi:hypothetical protein